MALVHLSTSSQLSDEIADLEIQAGLRERPQLVVESRIEPAPEKRPGVKVGN